MLPLALLNILVTHRDAELHVSHVHSVEDLAVARDREFRDMLLSSTHAADESHDCQHYQVFHGDFILSSFVKQ